MKTFYEVLPELQVASRLHSTCYGENGDFRGWIHMSGEFSPIQALPSPGTISKFQGISQVDVGNPISNNPLANC